MKKTRIQEGSLMGILKEPVLKSAEKVALKAESVYLPREMTSRLDVLIKQLCPEGVEYKTLGDIASFHYGYTDKARENGNARFIRITDITDTGCLNPYNAKYIDLCPDNSKYTLKKGDLLMARTGATYAKTLYYPDDKPAVYASFLIKISPDNSILSNRYYWHFSQSSYYWTQANNLVSKAGQPQFNSNVLCKIKIPVPPLPVQGEIVRILDNFAELTAELTTELTTELTKRKQQYQYYRDNLLTFNNIRTGLLGDLCYMAAGKAISSTDINTVRSSDYQYECWGGNGVRGFVKDYNQKGDFPLIGRQGALCGNVQYASGTFYATEHAVVVDGRKSFIPKFLYYMLQVLDLSKYKTGGAQPGLAVGTLKKVKIPVPPLPEQQRIVDILERFDTLCNDITSGLPAEIEARKKQYEYYRDKLLSFKEAGK